MELAIPLIALGGMYIVSNQKNTNNSETNKNQKHHTYNNCHFNDTIYLKQKLQ